jgi:hypothetical protein
MRDVDYFRSDVQIASWPRGLQRCITADPLSCPPLSPLLDRNYLVDSIASSFLPSLISALFRRSLFAY